MQTDLDRVVQLPDGRQLGYAEYGVPAGQPVLFFHGTPGSRRQVHADMGATAEKLGLRLLAPERPGYGLSSPQPDRSLLDWATDIADFTAALGIDRFSIVGFSGGGSYALACAHELPKRVDRLALIGSLAPMDSSELMAGMGPQVRGIFDLARANPAALPDALAPMAVSADALFAAMAKTFPACDEKLLRQRVDGWMADCAEVVRGGIEGVTRDFVLAASPWGFSLGDIKTRVDLWHGSLDCNVPRAMADYLAASLPSSTLSILENTGHLALFTHWVEILAQLVRKP